MERGSSGITSKLLLTLTLTASIYFQVIVGKKLLMTAPESRNKTDANMFGVFTIAISAKLSKFKVSQESQVGIIWSYS